MTSKTSVDDLAIFGGPPLFTRPRPTGQLYSPDREMFLSRLEQILQTKRFSNDGPMQRELEERVAHMHRVKYAVAFCNASIAIVALLHHLSLPGRSDVLLPTFSYRGLPHLIQWAGLRPRFCDVGERTHTLTGPTILEQIDDRTAAVLAVNHVNAPADLEAIRTLAARFEVPVIYDSVYAIAASFSGLPFGGNGAAEVFSLHATKLVNGFEGGYVTTNDPDLASAMRSTRNFGYDLHTLNICRLGTNGKLNEIHAAMAIASLEQIDEILKRNYDVYQSYRYSMAAIGGLDVVAPKQGMVSNHEMVLVETNQDWPIGRDQTVALLQAENALARPYFSPPLHRSKHCPPDVVAGPLPTAEALATRFFQLPTGAFLERGDPERIGALLDFVGRNGDAVRERLGGR